MSRPSTSVAAALLTACAMQTVAAQGSVTVYGRLDVAVESIRFSGGPAGSRSLRLLANDGSRLGFRGSEDLGGGLRAMFNIEAALSPDTGASATPFWGRQSWVGIGSSKWGDLLLGRNYSPMDDDAWYFDAFQYAGNAATYQIQKYAARVNNSVKYVSPKWSGLQLRLLHGLAENDAGAPAIGRTTSANLSYFGGPMAAKAAVQKVKIAGATAGTAEDRTDTYLGFSYDLGVAKPNIVHFRRKDSGGVPTYKSIVVGVNVPLAGGDLRANRSLVKQGSMESHSTGIGYWYPLSRRTFLYTAFNRNDNDAGSNLLNFQLPSYTAIATGESANSLQVGMRHNF